MGNCLAPPGGVRQRRGADADREKAWRATGIVALPPGAREVPSAILAQDLAPAIRVLDATGAALRSLPAGGDGSSSGGGGGGQGAGGGGVGAASGGLARLVNLSRLAAPNNYIETLPASLFALTALKTLVLSGNRLSSLPGDPSAWARLARLETLDVGGNAALTALPAALGRLGALRTLAAPRCSLRGLPAELGGCGALEAIDVCDNPSLDSFPKELGRLKRLKAVAADRTAVASVPPEVLRGCASLQTLSLRGCPIAAGALEATEGYAEFEARRRGKVTKIMQGGAATTGFDEGVDRELASPRPSSGMSGGGGGGGGAGGALRPASGLSGGGGGLAAAGGGGGAGGAAPSRRGTAS